MTHDPRPSVFLLRGVVAATAGLLLVLACVLALRRLAGALEQPLTAAGLLAAGALLALLATLLRWLWWRDCREGTSTWWRWMGLLLPAAALLLLGFSLSLPGSSLWGLGLLWGILLTEESGWWLAGVRQPRRDGTGQADVERAAVARPPEAGGAEAGGAEAGGLDAGGLEAGGNEDEPFLEEEEPGLPPDISQRIVRARQEDGGEVVWAVLRGDFEPGQRSQSLHLAFCPPLAGQVTLTVDQLDGPAVSIKPALVQSYGARLDLRLSQAHSVPTSVVVQVCVRAK